MLRPSHRIIINTSISRTVLLRPFIELQNPISRYKNMLPTTPIVFLAIFSAVSARPKLQRRGLPGASYTCTGADFSGNCQWNQPSDRCRDDGAAKGKPNGILSLGPDEGGSCDLFSEPGCKGEKLRSLTFPGDGDLAEDFASFSCKADPESSKHRRA
jgi:hypothetical protein